jgi:glyoxylase-like metal-dependent hydrolase (beta-lactamase superfamily II)
MTDRLPPKFDLGEFTLYAISDGLYRLDGGAMFGTVPKMLWDKVKPPDERNRIDMCLTCLLAVRGNDYILIETGIGDKNPARFNEIYGVDRITTIDRELAKLGLTSKDINHVALTHMHFDHAGGLAVRGDSGKPEPHFPNALHHIHKIEWEAATHPHARNRASYIEEDWFSVHKAGLIVIEENKEFEVVPGITGTRIGGHTPGLTIYRTESQTPGQNDVKTAIFPGDLIPTGAHVPVPWIMGYDLDPSGMVDLKEKYLPIWSEEHALVVFVHEPGYPWGFITKDDKGRFGVQPLDQGWLETLRRVPWPTLP